MYVSDIIVYKMYKPPAGFGQKEHAQLEWFANSYYIQQCNIILNLREREREKTFPGFVRILFIEINRRERSWKLYLSEEFYFLPDTLDTRQGISSLVRYTRQGISSLARYTRQGISSLVRYTRQGISSLVRYTRQGISSLVRYTRH